MSLPVVPCAEPCRFCEPHFGDRWLQVGRAIVSLERRDVWLDLAILEGVSEAHGRRPIESAASVARGAFLAGFTLRDSPDFDDWRAPRAAAAERAVCRHFTGDRSGDFLCSALYATLVASQPANLHSGKDGLIRTCDLSVRRSACRRPR